MKSIGEISIAAARKGGISGILVVRRREAAQPQEPQHSGPKGRWDRLRPASRTPHGGTLPVNADETESEIG